MATSNEMDAAETLGLIKGLTAVVQPHIDTMKTTNSTASGNRGKFDKSSTRSKPTLNSGLRLPNLVLPEFTGKEPSDCFLDHLHNLLISSNVPTQYWLTYLKQKCSKDSRAYDALVSAEDTYAKLLGPDVIKASDHDNKQHFEACANTLREKRAKPRDQQIRDLLSTYYVMCQHP